MNSIRILAHGCLLAALAPLATAQQGGTKEAPTTTTVQVKTVKLVRVGGDLVGKTLVTACAGDPCVAPKTPGDSYQLRLTSKPAAQVKIERASGTVEVVSGQPRAALARAITEEGYRVEN